MKKLILSLATIAVVLVLTLLPLVALADNATESTVDTGLVWADGINANFQHNTWYSVGRHWVMYVETELATRGVKCASTADYGATWDEFMVVSTTTTLFRGLSVWYDASTNLVHYARVEITGNNSDMGTGDIIYYRAGTPNAGGTITWVATETALEGGIGTGANVATIAITCDENGYPWVGWIEDEYDIAGNLTGYYWPEVANSDTNDGTWTGESAFEEFDAAAVASYGHDYDALLGGAGNWTCIAINLTPIDSSDLIQVAWSVENVVADDAGIDSTYYDGAAWGNLSWVVPVDPVTGLWAGTMGEIEFDFYDIGSAVHCVYADVAGDLNYNAKSAIQDWDDINGAGNWTEILDYAGFPFPSLSGYNAPGVGEDLICVYHDYDSLYYKIKSYGAAWDTSWTKIWDIDDHDATPLHSIFMQNTQYKYGAGSPVGFAWDWGTLEWGNSTQTGELNYWWIDYDGTATGDDVLGWFQGGADLFGSISWLIWLIALVLCAVAIFRGLSMMQNGESATRAVIEMIAWVVAIVVVATLIAVLD